MVEQKADRDWNQMNHSYLDKAIFQPLKIKMLLSLTRNMVQNTNDTTNETETINHYEKSFQLLIIRLSC